MISTDRLILRRWKNEDLIPFASICAEPEVMQFMPKPLGKKESEAMIKRIEDHFEKQGFGLFALEKKDSKKFIGYTGFMIPGFEHFFTPCVEIGWRLDKSEWNKGYATEAAKACLQYGFNILGFDKIYSFTSTINFPSIRVMEKIGMEYESNFYHPALPAGHSLSEHVLYRINNPAHQLNLSPGTIR
ncbi:MAG: GNAT family N-acetyltransferase [Chitinophagales bacterium]